MNAQEARKRTAQTQAKIAETRRLMALKEEAKRKEYELSEKKRLKALIEQTIPKVETSIRNASNNGYSEAWHSTEDRQGGALMEAMANHFREKGFKTETSRKYYERYIPYTNDEVEGYTMYWVKVTW